LDLSQKHREAVFQPEFIEDLQDWAATNRKTGLRIMKIAEAVLWNPFHGIGKPEPLKFLAQGTWSRRITCEHRLVYLVQDHRIDFLQAQYHY
jgi:toxin YoeB